MEAGHRVEFVRGDGTTECLTVSPEETILAATDDSVLDLRHGCREGRCVSCTARLLEGEIEYVTEPHALTRDRRADGFVLLCIARPLKDCRLAVGREVLADAFPGLWRNVG